MEKENVLKGLKSLKKDIISKQKISNEKLTKYKNDTTTLKKRFEKTEELKKLVLEKTKKKKLKCATQDKSTSIYLHIEEGSIPLWKVASTIKYYVDVESFSMLERGYYAEYCTEKALKDWNISEKCLKFEQVYTYEESTFVIHYSKYQSGSTLARAFFPQPERGDIVIYPLAFDNLDQVSKLHNTLAHELGHVMGLRHEFAQLEGNTVLFGKKNPQSVMNYNDPPIIQQQDRKEVEEIYQETFTSIKINGSNQLLKIKRIKPVSDIDDN